MKPFPIILSALHAYYPRTAIVKLVLTAAVSSTIDIAATIAIMVKLGNHGEAWQSLPYCCCFL